MVDSDRGCMRSYPTEDGTEPMGKNTSTRPPRDMSRSLAPVFEIQASSRRRSVEARDIADGRNPSPGCAEIRLAAPASVSLSSSLESG
jgi:hypothetical protein